MDLVAKVVPLMNPHGMSEVFDKMKPEKVVELFKRMDINHIVLFIRIMKQEMADRTMNALLEEKSSTVRRMLHILENTVGSHMDPFAFALNKNPTVKEAMAALKKNKRQIQIQLLWSVTTGNWRGSFTWRI